MSRTAQEQGANEVECSLTPNQAPFMLPAAVLAPQDRPQHCCSAPKSLSHILSSEVQQRSQKKNSAFLLPHGSASCTHMAAFLSTWRSQPTSPLSQTQWDSCQITLTAHSCLLSKPVPLLFNGGQGLTFISQTLVGQNCFRPFYLQLK